MVLLLLVVLLLLPLRKWKKEGGEGENTKGAWLEKYIKGATIECVS